MKYKTNWCEKKNNDWILASILPQKEDGTWDKEITDVSINRTAKNGQVFPNFDTIAAGVEIEGEFWQSQAGKSYLFAPKPKLEAPAFIKQASNSAFKAQQIEKTMARKEESIGKFQDTKEWSIKVASTMGKAVDLAIAEKTPSMDGQDLAEAILKWRKYLWNNWDINLEDTDAISGKLN